MNTNKVFTYKDLEKMSGEHIIIPEGYTRIESDAFLNQKETLKSIFIPKTVWKIDKAVSNISPTLFPGCFKLQEINVDPENLTFTSDDGVLFNKVKTELLHYPLGKTCKSYVVPEGVVEIGTVFRCSLVSYSYIYDDSFKDNGEQERLKVSETRIVYFADSHLESITLPEGLTHIERYAFAEQRKLKSINIPSSVTGIGKRAFYNCDSLKSLNIPEGVKTVCATAFSGCRNIVVNCSKSLLFKRSTLMSAHDFAYEGYSSALTVTIGSDMKRPSTKDPAIRKRFSYEDADKISGEHFIIPDGYTEIFESFLFEEGIFYKRDDIKSITIPGSLTELNGCRFSCCGNLENIYVSENNPAFLSIDGVLFSKDKTVLYRYPDGRQEESYIIPEGVKTISCCAFYGCDKLRNVSLPTTVNNIESRAFGRCRNLFGIDIPESVKRIDPGAFDDCESLTSLTIPKNVWDFYHPRYKGQASLGGCFRLTDFHISEDNLSFIEIDGVLYNKAETTLLHYPTGNKRSSYTIPDGVESIYGAFSAGMPFPFFDYFDPLVDDYEILETLKKKYYDKTFLEKVNLPDSVTDCFYGEFQNYMKLKSINIPGSMKQISPAMFKNCINLVDVAISEGVETLRVEAFRNCISLTNLIIPKSINSIDKDVFKGCINLTIQCCKDSEMHKYAVENNIKFKILKR